VLEGHARSVDGALALADGRLLSWSRDGTLRLWSVQGEALGVLAGHTGNVNGALALADGRLLSWSDDGTLRLWSSQGSPLELWGTPMGAITKVVLLADRCTLAVLVGRYMFMVRIAR
jgi:WD40 repeat protein